MAQPSTKVATLFTFIWLFLAPALHASAAGVVINNHAPVSNYQQVTLSLTSPYSGGEMSLMNDADSDWQPWVPVAATKRWQLSYNSGYNTVAVRFRDSQGTISETYSSGIQVDLIADLDFADPHGSTLFGSTGKNIAKAVVVQANGKIVVAGSYDYGGGDTDLAVLRYNSDGTLDTTFNGSGYFVRGGGVGADTAKAVAIQPDGKIVVVGTIDWGANDTDAWILRLTSSGSLDPTFGTNGYTTMGGSGKDSATGVALQPDGKILVLGNYDYGSGTVAIVIRRYTAAGVPDSSFGAGSWYVFKAATGLAHQGNAIAIQPDGKIVFTGAASFAAGSSDTLLARLTSNGTLDTTTFNSPYGYTNFNDPGLSGGNALAIQSDGKIVLVCTYDYGGGDTNIRVRRLNSTGRSDSSFNTRSLGNTGADLGRAVAIQTDGKIIIGGSWDLGNGDTELYLKRLMSDGTTDYDFYPQSADYLYGYTGGDIINGVAVQPDGKIVAVGAEDDGTGNTSMLTLRLHGTLNQLAITNAGPGTVAIFPGSPGNPLVPDTQVELTATPSAGAYFTGWGGACAGTLTSCVTTMNNDKMVAANFISQSSVTKSGNQVLILARNASAPDSEELKVADYFAAKGFTYQVADAAMIAGGMNLSPYKWIYFRTGAVPTSFNTPTVLAALKSAIESGASYLPDLYGSYLVKYLGWGDVSNWSWAPGGLDSIYYVKPIDNHPVFSGVTTWDPPGAPDLDAQLINGLTAKTLSAGVTVTLTQAQALKYWFLYTTYGGSGLDVSSAYCQSWGGCSGQRSVIEGSIPYASHGNGKVVVPNQVSMAGKNDSAIPASHGTAGDKILLNILDWSSAVAKNTTMGLLYPRLAAAFATTRSGDEIRTVGAQLTGSFTLNTGINLKGGWDDAFGSSSGQATQLNGDLTIQNGSSVIDTVAVKGKIVVRGGCLRVNRVQAKP